LRASVAVSASDVNVKTPEVPLSARFSVAGNFFLKHDQICPGITLL
jgi:hypothetical protein